MQPSRSWPVMKRYVKHFGIILQNNNVHRQDLARRIIDLYNIRSGLVHLGEREVLHSQANLAQDIAEQLFFKILNDIQDLQIPAQEFQRKLDRASWTVLKT